VGLFGGLGCLGGFWGYMGFGVGGWAFWWGFCMGGVGFGCVLKCGCVLVLFVWSDSSRVCDY